MATDVANTTKDINGLWELPDGWKWVPLAALCSNIVGGGTPKRNRPEYFGGDIIWVTPTDLNIDSPSQRITNPCQEITTSRVTLTQLGSNSSSAKPVPAGTVLLSSRATIGKIAIAGAPLCTNQGFVNFLCSESLDNHYLAWCLKLLTNEIKKLAGETTYLEVSRGDLRRFNIPMPFPDSPVLSRDIQHRVVTRIEALWEEVEAAWVILKKMHDEITQLLGAAINEVYKKLEKVSNIVPLKDVATAFNGIASGEGSSLVRVFKTRHVYPHRLRLDKPSFMKAEQARRLSKEKGLRSGDVLMANIAEGTLGRVTYVDECEDLWTVDTQIMILRSLDENALLLGKWLYYYLWSARGQSEILARRTGIAFADKRGQTHIYPKDVLGIPVLLPPIDHQRQAVTYLDSIQQESDEMRQLISQDVTMLEQLGHSILSQAFKGWI